MIKYIGFTMIAAAGIFVSREYEKNQRKRLSELSEFIRLFEHIKSKIDVFLSPKADWLSDFYSQDTTISKFLIFADNLSLQESFEKIRDKLSLGEEKELISTTFAALGKGYKEGEIRLLESAVGALKNENSRLSCDCEKNVKTFKVIAAAVSLGLIILLL